MLIKEPARFLLATLRSGALSDNETLSEYGLGTIFNSWELKLITKGP